MLREFVAGKRLLIELSIVYQHLRLSLNPGFDLLVPERKSAEPEVECDQRGGGDQPAHKGVVARVDRVLNGVGQHEEQHEIERRQLPDLALARQAKSDEQERIDDDRTKNEFGGGDG